ncbi:ATP-binding protein, partial [Glaciimonas sp. CA11.2]
HCRIYKKAYHDVRLNLDLDVIEAEVPEVLKLDIFRIIQEALNNVAKHAQASEVTVSLHVEHANMRLIIRDNGKGFDSNPLDFSTANQGGLGLK